MALAIRSRRRVAPGVTVLVLGVAAAGCSGAPAGESTGDDSDALRTCAHGATVKGVDVSYYEATIDWHAVKGSGRVFAFARVSDGLHHVDPRFAANWTGMRDVGLVRGAYQYFRPSQDPIAQADLLLSKLGTRGSLDLPPVLDVETADGVSAAHVQTSVHRWLTHVENALGRKPILYTAAFMSGTLGSGFSRYTLWVANYGATCPSMPAGFTSWAFWQTSETGHVPGIPTATDLDVFNGTSADLTRLAQQ